MAAEKELRVGLVGYGFMGKAHSNAYCTVNNFFDLQYRPVLKAVCGRNEESARAFADQWRYESVYTDWRQMVARDDIDAIDICTPNESHAEIAIAAAQSGKMILCEKPLSMTAAEGEAMVKAAEDASVKNTVWYNYRRVPAVTLAKMLIDQGRLGRIFHYRANFLQDWTISEDLPQGGTGLWRLDVGAAGSGVLGDLLAHCIDAAMWHNGDITRVCARTKTFITERMHTLTGKVEKVGIDDACLFLCDFSNGSLGNFESTRYARGHKAEYTFEINGENASIAWNLHDLHRLGYYDHRDDSIVSGWRSVHVTDGDMPYMDKWWVPGLQIGYEHTFVHQVADFLKDLETGDVTQPDFRTALQTQKVCDAVLESARTGEWVETGV
jgi:predicted dehydrogenase